MQPLFLSHRSSQWFSPCSGAAPSLPVGGRAVGWMTPSTNPVQPVYLLLLTACHALLLLCLPWKLGQRPQRGYSRLVMKISASNCPETFSWSCSAQSVHSQGYAMKTASANRGLPSCPLPKPLILKELSPSGTFPIISRITKSYDTASSICETKRSFSMLM